MKNNRKLDFAAGIIYISYGLIGLKGLLQWFLSNNFNQISFLMMINYTMYLILNCLVIILAIMIMVRGMPRKNES